MTYDTVGMTACDPGFMSCSDGSCIPLSAICNGSQDCPLGEDEFNCTGITNSMHCWFPNFTQLI